MHRWLWLLAGLVICACNVQTDPNANSGGDESRLKATEIPVNRTIIDNVNYNAGDMTDWKYFNLPSSGLVEFLIAFDNPSAKGTAIIRDARGAQVTRVDHQGEPKLQTTFRGQPGIYYLEIYANQEMSDYTLEVNFDPGI